MLTELVSLLDRSIAHARYKMSKISKSQILQKNGLEVLKDLYHACNKAGIKAFLAEGTLLGHHRENGFIKHDHDIDLGILEDDIKKIGALERTLRRKGYAVKKKKHSVLLRYHKPHADIYFFRDRGQGIISWCIEHKDNSLFRYDFPAAIFSHMDKATFADRLDVLVPCRVEDYLTAAYGDWKTPIQKQHLFFPNLRIENMKAVILADRKGTEPKAIGRLLRLLDKNGIVETIIVLGHKEHLIKAEITTQDTRLKIKCIRNNRYAESGTGYSLYLIKDLINDNTILLEPRALADECTMKQVIRSKHKNAIMIAEPLNDKAYPRVCIARKGRITNIGKTIPQQDSQKIAGTTSGMSKFSKDFLLRLFKQVEPDIRINKLNVPYEEYISIMIKNDRSFRDLKIIRPDIRT